MNKIATQIKNQRKALNLSQLELAELSGVGINTLVAIERAQGNPSLKVLLKLADCLGLELSFTPKRITGQGMR
ncbi:MAG: helix-turn-helix transcriptional regulator [Bacteroidales bacterium]|nr:helix-turn-helix transcriptional regulator [Bacteroidales bacterium]